MTMEIAEAELVTVVDIALTFPSLPTPLVDRSYLVDTIDSIFEASIDCVFLEGPEEIGKTVLCAQFAERHRDDCFCLFVREFSDLATDAGQIRFDLANQFHWFLYGTRIEPSTEIGPDFIRHLVLLLQRKIKNQKREVYFILDGIQSLCAANAALEKFFYFTLPLGFSGFKFLFSGSQDQIPGPTRRRIKSRPHTVSPFSPTETSRYFSGLEIQSESVAELHRTLRGIPGRLAAVRRLIEAGASINSLLDMAELSVDLLLPEWKSIDQNNKQQLDLIASIAFLPECREISRLVNMLDCSSDKILEQVKTITFLEVSADARHISFVSDSFQRFVRRRLAHIERQTIDAAIQKLHSSPETGEALRLLPEYFARNNRLHDLAVYLDCGRIAAAIRALHSVSEVLGVLKNIQAKSGLASDDPLVLRCAISRPLLSETMRSDQKKDQVETLLALNRDSNALSLANSTELDEQRLLLLSIIARVQRSRGIEPDVAILDEISRLSDSIDFSRVGDQAIDVAANLATVVPELAAKVLEAFAKDKDDPNAFDQAIVNLSFRALREAQGEQDGSVASTVLAQVNKLARTDATKAFARTAALIWKTDDHEAVLNELNTFKSTSEKLFFARQWLNVNWNQPSAIGVALGAYKLVLSDTAYAPNATLFRDLALPLIGAMQSSESLRLLSFLEGQSEHARSTGPLVDYFRMRFRMAIARTKWYSNEALASLEDDALAIESIKDYSVRASCYAWLVRCLRDIGLGDHLEDSIGLRSFAEASMKESISTLLKGTADQVEALSGLLAALSDVDLESSIDIAASINTEDRRNSAYRLIAEKLLVNVGDKQPCNTVFDSIRRLMVRITHTADRNKVALAFLNWQADRADKVLNSCGSTQPLEYGLSYLSDPDARVIAIAKFLSGIKDAKLLGQFSDTLIKELSVEWNKIENDALKASAGNEAVACIAKVDKKAAGSLFETLIAFVQPRSGNLDYQRIWRYMVLLQGRSIAALAATHAATDDDLKVLSKNADNILSQVDRATILSHSALSIWPFDNELAKSLISEYVAPKIAELISSEIEMTTELRTALMDTTPAMWIVNQASALNQIRKLEYFDRQNAIDTLLWFVISGRSPREPWSTRSKNRRSLTPSIIEEAISLLEEANDDSVFYSHAAKLLENSRDRVAGARINENQKAHLIRSIRDMADRKLPDPRGIKHEGWRVLIEAQLQASENEKQTSKWELLFKRASDIPNLADACYIFTHFVSLVPKRFEALRNDCFSRAEQLWNQLPTFEERVARLEIMFDECGADYPLRLKPLVQQCIKDFTSEPTASPKSRFHALVEMAHKIDEEWAASLVSITDDDPARKLIKAEAKERLSRLRLNKRISGSQFKLDAKDSLTDIARACWSELGTLNVSRMSTKDFGSALDLIGLASNAKLDEAFPIISYALASLAVKYANNENVAERLRAIHSAIFETANLVSLTVSAISNDLTQVPPNSIRSQSTLEIVAEPRSRAEVLSRIGEWLATVKPARLDVVDPYFRPQDACLLELIYSAAPECCIRVLTSTGAQQHSCMNADGFRKEINRELEQLGINSSLPSTIIYLVGRSSDGHMGIHDRWWLSEVGGIEFGSSFNGIGLDKITKIREIDLQQVIRLRTETDPYFQLLKRTHAGEKLNYATIVL